jgi:hypothetical protein
VPDEASTTSPSPGISIDHLQAVASVALKVPKLWTGAMVIAALLSAIHIDVSSAGRVSGSFAPSALTGILIALIWLPALIRVIALAGGGLKTPAGEASTGGLLAVLGSLEPKTKRDTFPTVIAALSSPEVVADPAKRTAVRPIRQDLELQFAAASPIPVTRVRERLAAYAEEYERVRAEQPPSGQRTHRMTTLVAEARAVARAAPLPLIDIRNMLSQESEGERVIALALIQDQPDARVFDLVVDAITQSRSAFEQYQALGAALELVPLLDYRQRRSLGEALNAALRDESRNIAADSSRLRLVDAINNALESV